MNNKNHDFLAKGGEMGSLIRAKDWSKTSLGEIETWPQSLRTTLGILMHSKFPMFLFWGPLHICFYNDAYRPSLGKEGKHPHILGEKGETAWPEIWDFVKQQLDLVLSKNESTWHEDKLLPIFRNGKVEEVYWTFSNSPVNDHQGNTVGVLVICNETTEKVNLHKKLKDTTERYRNSILQAPNAMCVFRGPNHVIEIINTLMLEIWERTEQQVIDKPVFEALPEARGQGLEDILQHVYSTGEKFTAYELPVKLSRKGQIEDTFINVTYEALRESNGEIYGITAIAADVTLQVLMRKAVEESEKRFRETIKQLPLGIGILRGPDLIIEMANPTYLQIIDKQEKEVLGRPVFDVVPEARETVYPLLSKVFTEGIPYHSDELKIVLNRYGKEEECYFNLVFHPIRGENNHVSGIIIASYEVTEEIKAKHLLTESENAFRKIVTESPIAMAIFRGKDHIIELANTTMMKTIWQKEEKDTLGKPLLEIFPELMNQKYPELLNDVIENGRTIRENESVAYVDIRGKLKKFYLDYEYTPLYEKDGAVSGIMVTVNDVTPKVKARRKLENAEERIRLAAEIAEIATWDLNLQTRKLIYTENILDIFGFEKNKKIIHQEIRGRIHPEDEIILQSAFEEALETSIYKYEARIIKPDNSIAWIKVHGKIFFDEFDEPAKMIGTVMDFTIEKEIQQVLLSNERKFRLLADSMPQMIWTSDTLGNLNYFNNTFYTYTGLSKEEIDENGWLQIVHPEDREENVNIWMESVKTGKDFLLIHRFRHHNGEFRWQLSRAIAQKDELGNIQMWVGTSTDIEDQKNFSTQLEEQIMERTTQLELKNRDLVNMNIELQSFAYISSHDLQEPLRKIQTFASRLSDLDEGNISAIAKTYLARIEVSAKKMQNLIQDLLTYSRTNSAERVFTKVKLDEIAEEVISDFSDRIEEKGARIEFKNLGEATLIQFQFRQLFHNIIGNALKFTKKGVAPVIKIETEKIKGSKIGTIVDFPEKMYLHLKISDNGIGFDPVYKERIFEVFQRLNTESEYSGTGIGLAIVKKIVENHKGIIMVFSEKDQGSVFNFYFPDLA
ncbi:PAS domain-containing sensor histidine kinase [Flavobacterium foetidum]|uniref:PAS domain-containing sensor histidine kinase n=1 Tax=Flavobacterium foetidum TaxID=2026681 RepID=UPI0010756199|nr:PAS domain S-box protein [Flavobacterium foetidum]KAF2518065.1 PAS domain-containing protein [Flavobacterium foetidum]